MTKTLGVPDEPRFVRAFAPAIDPGDTQGLLMEIGALGSPDIGIVRRTREALAPAHDWPGWTWRAGWLPVPDSSKVTHTAADFGEAPATIGRAVDSVSSRLMNRCFLIQPGPTPWP